MFSRDSSCSVTSDVGMVENDNQLIWMPAAHNGAICHPAIVLEKSRI